MNKASGKDMLRTKQATRFKKAARELGCSEDEEAFDKAIKKLATAPPPKLADKSKTKKK